MACSVMPSFFSNTTTRTPSCPLRTFPNSSSWKKSTLVTAKLAQKNAMQYRKLGDSDLNISEIAIGTMTFGEQNSEKEAHEILSYSFDQGINIIDTAEAYPVPMKKETQGTTDLYISSWLKSRPRDKVRYIGVSNETSYGVMEFVHAAKIEGLLKIVSIQNSYSLLVRCHFEGRLNLFPGYMERYNKSLAKEATKMYEEVAKKHGLTLVELALGFARDRPFMTSSIIGATSVDQLKEDIDAFLTTERPLPPQVMDDIEDIFKRYRDPASR
ncbi:unnamed protein product [Withania somnifera]